MLVKALTVGLPVRDLEGAVAWYRSAFELQQPDLAPVDGLVEFDVGPFWLQLRLAPECAGGSGISVAFSVENAADERQRLLAKGLQVSELERFEGVVEYFDLTDVDGNKIGFVTELM